MIAIDPGHGGEDSGCVGGGFREKDLTLKLAKAIQERATTRGIPTTLLRVDDASMRLSERGKLAKRRGATQAICLHFDTNPRPSVGRTTFYTRPNDSPSMHLAEAIGKHIPQQLSENPVVIATSPTDWRSRAHNVVRSYNSIPALLIEWAFLSNPRHVAYIREERGLEAMADATIEGIAMWKMKESKRGFNLSPIAQSENLLQCASQEKLL